MIELEPKGTDREVEEALSQTRVNVRELVVDFSRVPSEDPQAFAHGFYRGWCGDDILANGRSAKAGFSDVYLAGYRLGTEVLKGKAQMPEWASTL